MGAETFTSFSKAMKADEAFDAAVHQAQYDHGHSGYTGTIAEKDGFEMRSHGIAKMTRAEAYAFSEKDGESNDKWGKAYAVEVYDDARETLIGFLFYGWASS